MIFIKLLPEVLTELIRQAPTLLFDAIDWTELKHELPTLLRRVLKKEGYEHLFHRQKDFLSSFSFSEQKEIKTKNPPAPSLTQDTGIHLLQLYFLQLYSPHGVFLDLRIQNFYQLNSTVTWCPSSLWTQFSEPFRLGMIQIYEGFYLEDDQAFETGLILTGLLDRTWTPEKKEQLKLLFKTHFGDSLQDEMNFKMENFQESFFKIGDFLLKNKIKISLDFLYLGIYLISLHLSLNAIPFSFPVQKIFKEIHKKSQNHEPL